MVDICCGMVNESECSCDTGSRDARRRRMELRRVRTVSGVLPVVEEAEDSVKRRRLELCPRECDKAAENCSYEYERQVILMREKGRKETESILSPIIATSSFSDVVCQMHPKFGMVSVCGRRRDMEDAVAINPSFCCVEHQNTSKLHYFGVYDGHGCSHVATKCKERLHELVKEELVFEEKEAEFCSNQWWKNAMERSFSRMDKEVVAWNINVVDNISVNCRCELRTPECDAVGSTAVVAVVTPYKIIVANCGDSRAVLCRNGKAIPLSNDHKPDSPDELKRIQAAGGRVIFWEGARVLGVLAMSRAIGDNYLKQYVSCEPEVTITDRTEEDECLILASDGLWDVVSNDTACGVARMCLKGKVATSLSYSENDDGSGGGKSDKACVDAAMLLTKLALARGSADNVSVVVIDIRNGTSSVDGRSYSY